MRSCGSRTKFLDDYIDSASRFTTTNRPFSYSEKESGSNDVSLHLVEFSTKKNVQKYRSIQTLLQAE